MAGLKAAGRTQCEAVKGQFIKIIFKYYSQKEVLEG